MSNNYTFSCPVTGDGTSVSHCETVHKNGMQGKSDQTENKICALAHLCYMCPFRNAVRVGGPWSNPDKMPFAAEESAKPSKLPRDLVVYALAHTKPKDTDYRRAGLRGADVGIHDEYFVKLQQSVMGETTKVTRPSSGDASSEMKRKGATKPVRKSPEPSRPATALDALDAKPNDMADAVNELVQKEKAANKAPQSAKKPAATQDKQKSEKKPQQARSGVSDASSKPMTLAERAQQMKLRKTA